ncbi:MAG: tetratricopeptide repeat protein [Chloroherpetonaceae bacterium]|nr:tetratricopeptide repeat protein [Chloroherpetonaceae bacterium]MCS7211024.1 tetratricopeptide repeat protein [Chloroherpetonaceae bacterium]MDW8019425.1 tetratricopeptide repeat protein [Chloroherpetonaceae bacterium]
MTRLTKRCILLWLLCWLILPQANAQIERRTIAPDPIKQYSEQVLQGIDLIYNLEFEKAERIFSEIRNKDPKSPIGHFFLGMTLWWKMMLDIDNTQYDDEFCSYMEKTIEVCEERLERNSEDIEALFFKCGSLGFRGRLRANRESWLKAASDGKDALPIVNKLQKLDKDNYDILFGLGLYNYYAEVIPEKIPAVRPLALLFPKGDKLKGIRQLELASEKSRYARSESLYFLLQIYYVYEKDYLKAIEYARRLYQKYPRNVVFHTFLGRALASGGYWHEAEAVYSDVLQKCQSGVEHYNERAAREAHFHLGVAMMNSRRIAQAYTHFKQAEALSKKIDREPSPYQALTMLRLGMIYDLRGDHATAVTHYKKVLEMKDYQNSHQLAKTYIDRPFSG